MNKNDEIRKSVSETYTKALSQPAEEVAPGCCAPVQPGCCGPGSASQQSVISKLAGYGQTELSELPGDVVVNSFGCGNPLAYSEVSEGETVVDLGSGAGIDILLAGQKVGPKGKVIGIDMTDDMIERARQNIAAAGVDHVEVRKGVIEKLPVESSSVDWVISNCVINLSPEKDLVFAEIARVLKPGGRMLISDIVVEDLPDWARNNQMLYNSCVAGAISEEEYLEGLRKAGLEEVEVRDRLVYEAEHIGSFLQSEEACTFLASPAGKEMAKRAGEEMVGKVWSAKVFARKPIDS